METKTCKVCGQEKPLTTENFRQSKGHWRGACRVCLKGQLASWRQSNPQKVTNYYEKVDRFRAKDRAAKFRRENHEAFIATIHRYRRTKHGKRKHCVHEHKRRHTKAGRLRHYKKSARARELEFTLTQEQFEEFWGRPCDYCGREIEDVGLDRVDNKKGYVVGNVVPCCWRCNVMKAQLSREEFLAHCQRIVALTAPNPYP